MQSLYTYAITYLTWTQTSPVLAHLRNVYRDAANYLIIQENITVAKWSNYIYLTKHREIPYQTCAIGHKYMDAGFTAYVSRPSCLKPRHSDGERGLRLLAKPRFTDFSIEPRLAFVHDGTKPRLKCRPTAWGVGDKLGSSAAQMSGAAVSRICGARIYTGPVF